MSGIAYAGPRGSTDRAIMGGVDAAVALAIGLGGALIGVVGGFWGAFHLERRREAQRRLGIIAAFATDLSDNAVKCRRMLLQWDEEPEATEPLWDAIGPVSADFWRSHIVDAGSFLPFELLHKMRMAYDALAFVRDVGDRPLRSAPRRERAARIVRYCMGLLEEAAGDMLELPEGQAIKSRMPNAASWMEGQEARMRDA